AGCDFECIFLPIAKESFEFAYQNNIELQIALDSYTGQTSNHYPKHPIMQLDWRLTSESKFSPKPLQTVTLFTDGSGSSGKSVITWQDPSTQAWESDVEIVQGSPQVAELAAVVRAFERFSEPFNLVTDSVYVAGIVSRVEGAWLAGSTNEDIQKLLSKLYELVSHRENRYFVMHIRAHTNLPGFIAEGNRRADALAALVHVANLPDKFSQAKLSHALFHQNIPALVDMFELTKDQARAIVATCPNCQPLQLPSMG
ncbi:POK19 protein, partial [Origma solitaria]|nr:POK19 protein [Origma solitaria]